MDVYENIVYAPKNLVEGSRNTLDETLEGFKMLN